ncbi:MAG: hypothetical protein WCK94_13155 [Comamonadaceae bacterium]|jgi:hypothetical protein
MNSSLHLFLHQFVGVMMAALTPVVLVAFLSIPYCLGGHPGDDRTLVVPASQHMT